MARSLHNKSNVEAPSSDYPYGRIKDKVANLTAGTPVNEAVYGDFHQFFSRLMAEAGIEENGNPDNDYTGFQLYQALLKTIAKKVGQYSGEDELTPSASSNFNDYLFPGNFNVDGYNMTNGPGLDGPGQLIVSGNPDVYIIQRVVDMTNGAEWKRTWTVAVGYGGWVLLRYGIKEYNIGDWNMDTTGAINVTVPIERHRIKRMSCLIFTDPNIITGDIVTSNLEASFSNGGGYILTDTSLPNTVSLYRVSSPGNYDSIAYQKTGYNRGKLIIEYDPSNP